MPTLKFAKVQGRYILRKPPFGGAETLYVRKISLPQIWECHFGISLIATLILKEENLHFVLVKCQDKKFPISHVEQQVFSVTSVVKLKMLYSVRDFFKVTSLYTLFPLLFETTNSVIYRYRLLF